MRGSVYAPPACAADSMHRVAGERVYWMRTVNPTPVVELAPATPQGELARKALAQVR